MDPLPRPWPSTGPRQDDRERRRWAALRVALRRRAALNRLGQHVLTGATVATLRADALATAARLLGVPSCRIVTTGDGDPPSMLTSELCIPIPSEEGALEVLVAAGAPGQTFTRRDREFLRSVARLLALAEEQRRLLDGEREAQAQAAAARRRLDLLVAAGAELGAARNYADTLQRVIRVVVPALADACSLYLQEDGTVKLAAAGHADPAKEKALWEVLRHYVPDPTSPRSLGGAVLLTGAPRLVAPFPEAPSEITVQGTAFAARMRDLEVRAFLLVPLRCHDRVLGMVALLATDPGRHFTPADLAPTEALAGCFARAIDSARLAEQSRQALAEQERAHEESARRLAQERERRLAAEQLAAERAAMLAQVADGVLIADPNGRITFLNAAARRLDSALRPGVAAAEYAAEHLLSLTGQPCPPGGQPVRRALRGEAVVGAEYRLARDDGTEVVLRVNAAPVKGDDGRALGAVLALHDVTAEYEREREEPADFVAGDLAISFALQQVMLGGRLVQLTPLEFALLALLARNVGRVLPTSMLLDRLWGEREGGSPDSLKVYIHRLRAKLGSPAGPTYIETVRGLGYRFLRPRSA